MEIGRWIKLGHARQMSFGRARFSVRAVGGCGDSGGQRAARPTASALMNHAGKSSFDPEFGLGGCAVGSDAVLDGNATALVLAERCINQAVVVADAAVDDGEVFFLDGAGFPDFAQFAGGFGIFGNEDDPAGFAVEAVDQAGCDCAR